MPRCFPAAPPAALHRLFWLPLAAILLFTGCATAPVTYRAQAHTAERLVRLKTVVAPLDAELSEFTAGGIIERRDDWTDQAIAHLTEAFAAETGWRPPESLTAEQLGRVRDETEDVQSLLRAITLNHLVTSLPAPGPFAVPVGTLNYHTGPLTEHMAAMGDGAVLFVFVRNSYATAGRKALLAFSLIGAGLTGIAIVPSMGTDVISAALVETDGNVLWFNFRVGGADPRTPGGARELAQQILAGLPKRTT